MEYFKDPEWVVNFQRQFGVEEVHRSTVNKFQPYVACDMDAYNNFQKAKASNATSRKQRRQINGVETNGGISKYFANPSGDTSLEESSFEDLEEKNVMYYRIKSLFWHYVFVIGTQLGDENCYTLLFCFWFWNIDGAVGRRLYLVFNFVMYIGQGVKDVIRWPRPPMPPVIQLESKWSLEYGMPSTHSMVGLAVPMGILYFTYGRYQVSRLYKFPKFDS